jgi:hypothetical protein
MRLSIDSRRRYLPRHDVHSWVIGSSHAQTPSRLLPSAVVPRKEPRYRYKSERQHHIGDALEDLESRGLITESRLVFAHPPERKQWEIGLGAALPAWWYITDGSRQRRRTRETEQYISSRCNEHGIEWLPVPPPGGRDAATPVREILANMAVQGCDVLSYTAIAEHLRWVGISVSAEISPPSV